ncbi:hypothetical protein M758_1G323700 [Ceratodon purpureus]|nr:hypothetical protein M758_1G323700 [Ceratodon purpureus]
MQGRSLLLPFPGKCSVDYKKPAPPLVAVDSRCCCLPLANLTQLQCPRNPAHSAEEPLHEATEEPTSKPNINLCMLCSAALRHRLTAISSATVSDQPLHSRYQATLYCTTRHAIVQLPYIARVAFIIDEAISFQLRRHESRVVPLLKRSRG